MLRWRIAILISAAIAISYLDRQTLPVAIGEIQKEIPISNQVKAFLDSAFLITYGLMYLGGGRLMDVLGTRRGFLVIMTFWSVACASHAFAANYGLTPVFGLPFAVIMLRTTFAQIPIEIEEAARVDGCSRLIAFLRVTLPLARVGYIVVGSLVFLLAYGEFVYAISLMNKQSMQPATVGLYGFVGADYSDWGNAMAFATVMVLPVLIIFVALQKRIVSGLTSGALK